MPRLKSLKCFVILIISTVSSMFLCGYVLFDDSSKSYARGHLKMRSRYKMAEQVEESRSNMSAENEKYDENYLLSLAEIKSENDQQLHDEGYHQHAFNLLISEKLSFTRPLPDTRDPQCKDKVYPTNLPKASIVICFYNEAYSSLLRTVHSIYHRSPNDLIHEVILVNDNSEIEGLLPKLRTYLSNHLPAVKLVTSAERLGLIRARIFGARKATGEVLVFLDSHCEVNDGWLEPLLARVQENSKNVVIPIIDMINADTFIYEKSPLVKGGFNWGMHFRWDPLPASTGPISHTDPIVSPTMAGGLFAINRVYFHHLGEYDPGMDIWGGENLEISFRIWQCGGNLEILPCSRVGHIFRKRRPYGSPHGDSFLKNSLRVAHTWMDEYKKHFFNIRPEAAKMEYGDISKRLELRKQLGCKSFKWYLDNVYPEQSIPSVNGQGREAKFMRPIVHKDIVVKQKGLLKHTGSGLCVDSVGDVHVKKSLLRLTVCNLSNENKNQVWYETGNKEMRLANVLCLDVTGEGKTEFARLTKCGGFGSQEWIWNTKDGRSQLFNPASGMCLTTVNIEPGSYLTLAVCSSSQLLDFHLISAS